MNKNNSNCFLLFYTSKMVGYKSMQENESWKLSICFAVLYWWAGGRRINIIFVIVCSHATTSLLHLKCAAEVACYLLELNMNIRSYLPMTCLRIITFRNKRITTVHRFYACRWSGFYLHTSVSSLSLSLALSLFLSP